MKPPATMPDTTPELYELEIIGEPVLASLNPEKPPAVVSALVAVTDAVLYEFVMMTSPVAFPRRPPTPRLAAVLVRVIARIHNKRVIDTEV